MALIRSITLKPGEGRIHPTEVDAHIKIFGGFDRPQIVQIDTFGSDDRQISGKISQTIQLNKVAAEQLVEVLRRAYGI
jgi:hypothetical protein